MNRTQKISIIGSPRKEFASLALVPHTQKSTLNAFLGSAQIQHPQE